MELAAWCAVDEAPIPDPASGQQTQLALVEDADGKPIKIHRCCGRMSPPVRAESRRRRGATTADDTDVEPGLMQRPWALRSSVI